MSKRMAAILCVVILTATLLAACSFGGAAKKKVNGIEVEERPYQSEYGNKVYLIMTNKTGSGCDLEVTVNFLDDQGATVDTSTYSTYAFAQDSTISEPYYSNTPFASYNYDIEVKPLSYYEPVDNDLALEVNEAGEDSTIKITNNGSKTAKFVEYHALYFKNDVLVDYDWGYCDDDHDEIKPGASETAEIAAYEDYDSVKVYIHGRADKE